jgi:hypothetical protein
LNSPAPTAKNQLIQAFGGTSIVPGGSHERKAAGMHTTPFCAAALLLDRFPRVRVIILLGHSLWGCRVVRLQYKNVKN